MSLKDKVALITGASRGIGKAIATELAIQGTSIAFISKNPSHLEQTEKMLKNLGVHAKGYALDISAISQLKKTIDEILKEFGQLDFLVNNAGITEDRLLLRMSEEDWDKVLNTNLKASFFLIKWVGKHFLSRGFGRILNISSISGLIGIPGQANYSASKAGLIGLTRTVAKELGPKGITCNAICPGFIETDMTEGLSLERKEKILKEIPLGRFGKVEEVAKLAAFLLGPGGDYITGQTFVIDGGLLA
ncbi:3-oxoacyl-[acyl-carrier-protein] reductase [Methylacidiphilum caldifontis]|uniref:3-oxoacyl-[acyl-carrier-protein] reductase n=1 Tax=Methylacidiphilum caldifontis TaxID=2795386 RepID=A0A4Y8PF47_9BACT|nr:3-oxoacyl-[acyl-carrier-protein] reductase [Methylacidiphilum caldifontis]QSR88344.1 3-oxoacyl-[acyl-carrier-protein] reductase [Methylacidiphilum caldifontis]TFE70652.1 3-oxoacyl-[acyl-carrier-protein] reductase [Methylacidiphilum caldifontis]